MKILIVTKDLDSRGGVAAFFRLFRKYFHAEDLELKFLPVGSRPADYQRREHRHWAYFKELCRDLARFRRVMKDDREIQVVQVNPSLIPVALFRDALFLLLAHRYHKRTVVFFHGWRDGALKFFRRHKVLFFLFQHIFLRSDACFVLAKRFGEMLISWGLPKKKLHCTTTAYDPELVQPRNAVPPDTPLRLIYLGRISQPKGVEVLLEALLQFAAERGNFSLDLYGHAADSAFLADMRQKVQQEPRIVFHDYLDGEEKYRAFSRADVFVLPSFAEGCPTTLLEAGGAGCYLLATPVGAIPELLSDSRRGRLTAVGDSAALLQEIRTCANSLPLLRSHFQDNAGYAAEHWTMPQVVRQFTTVYRMISEKR